MTNPFVFACITPHGGEIIPELSGNFPERMLTTRESMFKLGTYMSAANPETIIVLTPHGVRIEGEFAVSDSVRMEGIVDENDAVYQMERSVDRDLTSDIVNEAKMEGLPVGAINFGTSSGPLSCLPLDWGAIVPLAFMPDNLPVVVITPSRDVSYEEHLKFGQLLAEVVRQSNKRVGLIASCDWSHAHDERGPYGFHPDAQKLDEEVIHIIRSNQLERMADFDFDYVENAKPDGIWQALILAGAIPEKDRLVEFLSYEVPTYFGQICAAFHSDRD